MFSNIWNHPKTSIAGFLLCVITIAGVLSQQGVSLGKAGTGTVIALISAIATALLGLLSRDPGGESTPGSTQKLGAWVLIALLLQLNVLMLAGCSPQKKLSVAQEIVNYGPTVTAAVDTAIATSEMLVSFPGDKLIFDTAIKGFDVLSAGVQQAAKDYVANPNQNTLAFLQAEIVKFQQSVNVGLLQLAQIKDPASQKLAIAAVSGVAIVANLILGLVQSISTKAQITAMSAEVRVPLAEVRALMDEASMQREAERVSQDLALNHAVSVNEFFAAEAQAGF